MMKDSDLTLTAEAVRKAALPLEGSHRDFNELLKLVGDAHLVLLGEASHGTHDFYRIRAELTKRLIREQGFTAVAVEADWPDAYRVNRYVRGEGADADAAEALSGFRRFPQWMWRNADVLDFVGWLREHNDTLPAGAPRAGFYGLDLYSLHASMGAVLTFLDRVDPEAAARARRRYACFDHFGGDAQRYGYVAGLGLAESCEEQVVSQLVELHREAAEYARRDGHVAEEEFFAAFQNARLVLNAERYYRAMFTGRVSSWNLRDWHMAETLDALIGFLGRRVRPAKVVVWAHNSHLGDARATEMRMAGEFNLGQLTRERHGRDCTIVGFTTCGGTVTAASDWNAPAERKYVRPALAESYEALFHETGIARFLLNLRDGGAAPGALREPRLERAIGVVYRPETERQSHYFHASLPEQFDAVVHLDATRAVEPLERTVVWEAGEMPETFPTGV